MNKCTIRFLRVDSCDATDDVIRVYEDPDFAEMYRITFTACGMKKTSEFYLDRHRTVDYIASVLKSLQYDTDPFEWVQVDTAIHPSILYHASDMDSISGARCVIEEMVSSALRRPVEQVRRTH